MFVDPNSEFALVQKVLDHVESGDIDKAVFACLRLARRTRDTIGAVMFLREMGTDKRDLVREMEGLKKEARDFVWKHTLEEWLEEREVDVPGDGTTSKKVLAAGVGELQREVLQLDGCIQDLKLPSGMGEFDTAAFTDRNATKKAQLRVMIRLHNRVLENIRARCLSYASRIETQLRAQESTSNLVRNLQSDVDNFFVARCGSSHRKLLKASSLVGSSNTEDHSLLLTTIRRAVKAVADYFYPPVTTPVVCADGQTRQLGEDQYLNRLQEFFNTKLTKSSSTVLMQAELDHLMVFFRRLNEVASKGVHADVTPQEARQGLLGLYVFLSNLIAKLQ